ncbi:MAG: hypothetical protein NWE76_05415, partial [Candidatus Bathyarchaeota archaeon]|nr:hypothetical protein [Candidatus Bathyarchaeota archaeon]
VETINRSSKNLRYGVFGAGSCRAPPTLGKQQRKEKASGCYSLDSKSTVFQKVLPCLSFSVSRDER